MSRLSLGFLVILLLGLPVAVHAGEGRIPIFKAPTTLSAPGKYFVSRNIGVSSGSILTITASNVEIDLNGFTLDGGSSGSPVIVASGVDGIIVRNGTILGGSRGLEITGGRRVVVEDIRAGSMPGGVAILMFDSTDYAIRRNVIRDATAGAIWHVGTGATVGTGTVEDNIVEDCGYGIRLEYVAGCGISGNRVRNSANDGIQLFSGESCLITGNTVDGDGIRLSSSHRTTVSHNVVSNATPGTIGIDVGGDDNLILENLVTNGGSIGILAGGHRNHLERNVSNGNSNWGFAFIGDDNVYRGNTGRNNGGVAGNPPACAAPCSPDLCIYTGSTGNASHGDNKLPGPPGFPACV